MIKFIDKIVTVIVILVFLPVTLLGVFLTFCVHAFQAGYDIGGPELIDKWLAEVENEN